MSYSSAKAMANKVSRQLSDTLNPEICPICLCDFAEDVSVRFAQHLPRLRVECHLLWDACVATITLQRSPDEKERLRAKLAMNHRRCRKREGSHYLRASDSQAYLHALLESASHIVKCAVHLGERNAAERATVATKSFADKRGRWPARVEQLFPHGERAAVDALLDYCELYISAGPLDVVSVMLVLARPVVFPLLAADATRARLVAVVAKMLDPVASGISRRAPWLVRDGAATERATTFLSHLVAGPGALPRDEAQFVAGHEAALLAAIAPVVERMPEAHLLFEWLASWCATMARRTDVEPPPRVAQWYAQYQAQRARERPACFAHLVHEIVVQAIGRRVCAGPRCGRSVLQDAEGKPFQVCGGCRVPRYCSRECQRRDWKGEDGAPLQHKWLCGTFAKLEAHRCPKLSLSEFEAVYKRAKLETFTHVDLFLINSFVTTSGHEFGHAFHEELVNTFPFAGSSFASSSQQPMDEETAAISARTNALLQSGVLEGQSFPVNFIMRL
ncbi:hypothetical protein AURDEDRAFT_187359 [Auricularia subglabra TFB-10046 SS5]|nr:hypothetical protein AURDEDRAFT_187359 [Auricularia subglabra TFB-10046 SS5]